MLEKDIKDVDASVELLRYRQEHNKKSSIIIIFFGLLYFLTGFCIYSFWLAVFGSIITFCGISIVVIGIISLTQWNYYNILIFLRQKEEK